ncbi:MaoC family dehydratase [Alphaproteobacteria bacterium]|nr:MaoC family dehydratase [Alphaproteobacteria bacterium]
MKYTDLYFEDFTVGRKFETDKRTILQKDIIIFGKQFAPLPYHTDPVAAKNYMFGELVAAGFHTCSISFGLFIEAGVFSSCAMGSPGFDNLRWKKPVRPGDTLQVTATVTEASPARDESGRNLIKLLFRTSNQDGEPVLEMHTKHFVMARPKSKGI